MTQTRTPSPRARAQGTPARTSGGSVRLTGRGGGVALFAVCFLSLLFAAWTGWAVVADVVFVMTCGLVSCYTKPAGLRSLVACPPLAFCAGSVLARLITAADTFSALTGILVTLGGSALWLFTGTGLTMAIAFGRGWRPELPGRLLGNLRAALRDVRPRGDRWTERRLPAGPDHSGVRPDKMVRTSAAAFWTSGGPAMGSRWTGICPAWRASRRSSMLSGSCGGPVCRTSSSCLPSA
jgi:uncharacterized protein DUF6542